MLDADLGRLQSASLRYPASLAFSLASEPSECERDYLRCPHSARCTMSPPLTRSKLPCTKLLPRRCVNIAGLTAEREMGLPLTTGTNGSTRLLSQAQR